MSGRPERREGGFTMTEIMVSVLLVGIAAAFTFSIQVRSSQAFRDQTYVAEAQQSLRAASDLLVRDARQAGYLSQRVHTRIYGTPAVAGYPIRIDNAANAGTDILTVMYSSGEPRTLVTTAAAQFNASPESTAVVSSAGFALGDQVLFTQTAGALRGRACIVELSAAGGDVLSHAVAVPNWNGAGNDQCSPFNAGWNGGNMAASKLVIRSYRIRPTDARGVLEMSASGGVENDWQALAIGIVDLQVAMRVAHDTDGDPTTAPSISWYSGDNMETILDDSHWPLALSISLVARTTKEVSGSATARTPDLVDVSAPTTNSIGDHGGTNLPVTDPTSRFYGNHVYRVITAQVDLRNMGVGTVTAP